MLDLLSGDQCGGGCLIVFFGGKRRTVSIFISAVTQAGHCNHVLSSALFQINSITFYMIIYRFT